MMNRIDLIRPDAPELAGRGGFSVGVRRLEVLHRNRPNMLASGASDRAMTVELWYPADIEGPAPEARYDTICRDGRTALTLTGRAWRDAAALAADFPLVILSHGYPGNRMLMSHLGETLASRGYLVASIDHPDSTYDDPAYLGGEAFASTLVNRPLDTAAVIEALGATQVAIIGYSMGGYGALVSGGAQVSERAEAMGGPEMARHRQAQADPRLKAVVAIGPWGRQRDIWQAEGLARLSVPALILAGSLDEISDYQGGIRRIFAEAGGGPHLLTFEGAGHNAAAPIPAPKESWTQVPWLSFPPFAHYADAVWDSVRMNNIAAHAVTAFLGLHLKGETGMARYLGPEFAGFAPGSARGLVWESRSP